MRTPETYAELQEIWKRADQRHPLELARRFGASIRRLEKLLDMEAPAAVIRHEQGVAERARMGLAASGSHGLDAIREHLCKDYTAREIAGNIEYFCREISIDFEVRNRPPEERRGK